MTISFDSIPDNDLSRWFYTEFQRGQVRDLGAVNLKSLLIGQKVTAASATGTLELFGISTATHTLTITIGAESRTITFAAADTPTDMVTKILAVIGAAGSNPFTRHSAAGTTKVTFTARASGASYNEKISVSGSLDLTSPFSDVAICAGVQRKVTGMTGGITGGTATANTLYDVLSASHCASLAGLGSNAYELCEAFKRINATSKLQAIFLDDNAGGTAATGAISAPGRPTQAGTLYLYIGGQVLPIAVAKDESPDSILQKIVDEISKNEALPILAAKVTGVRGSMATTASGTTSATGFVTVTASFGTTLPFPNVVFSSATGSSATVFAAALVAAVNASTTFPFTATNVAGAITFTAKSTGTEYNVNIDITGGGIAGLTFTPTVPAAAASGTASSVTLTAKNKGTCGNSIVIRFNHQGESYPTGMTAPTVTAMTGGAGDPSLTAAIAALGSEPFDVIFGTLNDTTSLDAWSTEITRRWLPTVQLGGMYLTAYRAAGATADIAAAAAIAFLNARNKEHEYIYCIYDQPDSPAEFIGVLAGNVSYFASIAPYRPLQTLEMKGIIPGRVGYRWDLNATRSAIITAGGSVGVVIGSVERIDQIVSTYKVDAYGNADPTWRYIEHDVEAMYFRREYNAFMAVFFDRYGLADTGTTNPDLKIATPETIEDAEIIFYQQMVDAGIAQWLPDVEKEDHVQAVRNTVDRGRVDSLIRTKFVDQLRRLATAIEQN